MGTSALRGNYTVIHPTVNTCCSCTDWKKMACEDCSARFTVIKRKKVCCDCKSDFCSSCVMRIKGIEKKHQCRRCRIFSTLPLDRAAIVGLRVRDLRWYLESKSISMQGCKEKSDLVDLIMFHAGGLNSDQYAHKLFRPDVTSNCEDSGSYSERCRSGHSSPIRTHESSSRNHPGPSSESNILQETQQPPDTGCSSPADFHVSVARSAPEINQESPSAPSLSPEEDTSSMTADIDDAPEPTPFEPDKEQEPDTFKPVSVEDLKDAQQILQLSVRQMKLILTRNFVDYRGCCEKQDLQEKVRRLWAQKCEDKNIDAVPDENLCKICMEAAIDSVLLECGHMATCTECGKRLHECPICRQYVVRVVHTFKA